MAGMSAAVLGILGLSTVQIAGIAIAAGLLVVLIIVLVVRSSRGSAEESSELAPPESTAPSFLDEAPRDDLDRLGRREVAADEEEVGATTGDLAEERHLDWGPTDQAVPLSEPMGPDDLGGEDAPAELTSPEPAPAEAAPAAAAEPTEETAEAAAEEEAAPTRGAG